MEEEKKIKVYTFVKNTIGSLYFSLESYDNMLPKRDFVINAKAKKIIVPHTYALGLFVSPQALNQFNKGYFKIEKVDELFKEGSEIGLCSYEEKVDKKAPKSIDEIDKIIMDENLDVLIPLLKKSNAKDKAHIVFFVNSHKNELRGATVAAVQEALRDN